MAKTAAQLDREIAEYMANPKLGDPKWERDWRNLLTEKHSKARIPTEGELARAFSYVTNEFRVGPNGAISGEQWAEGLAFGQRASIDDFDKRVARDALHELPAGAWLEIAERANVLSHEQGDEPRFTKGK